MTNIYSPLNSIQVTGQQFIQEPNINTVPTSQPHSFRFNGVNQSLEMWTGYQWQPITPSVSIDLPYDTIQVLEWAKEQMNKQQRLQELAQSHPTIAHALAEVDKAEQELELLAALVDS